MNWFIGLFAGGIISAAGLFGLACLIFTVIGIVVAFSAAWWMGVIALFSGPLATVNGIVYVGTWGSVNLAAKLVALILAV